MNEIKELCICGNTLLWPEKTGTWLQNIIILDWYDGIMTMVCRCKVCRKPKLISVISWQPDVSSIRVFGVADLTPTAFEQVEVSGRQFMGPAQHDYKVFLADLFNDAPLPWAVVASANIGDTILRSKRLENIERLRPYEDAISSEAELSSWLSMLDIPKS